MSGGLTVHRVTALKVEVYPSMRERAYPPPNKHTERRRSREHPETHYLGIGHTLIIFSQNMVYDLYKGNWTSETNTFLTNYVGAIGSAADGDLNHATYTVTGATGTALAAKVFQVIGDQPIISSGDTINPATGTDVLGTVVSDADGQLTPAAAIPIVVGRKTVGTAGTSKVVYVGAPVENILVTAAN